MLKPRASFDSLNIDALSVKGKFSLPTLRRYSSTTNLQQENVNTPQIIHRSLSSIFKKIPKTVDEKEKNLSDDDDNASIMSSDSSQLSFDEDTKSNNNKFISIFNSAFNNKNSNNNNNNHHKRKKYNFNEIIVSNEIIITTSDIMEEQNILSASPVSPRTPFTTFETHFQTPTQNYSYYYPNKSTIPKLSPVDNNSKDLPSIQDENFSTSTPSIKSRLSTPLLSEDDASDSQTSSRGSTSSQEVKLNISVDSNQLLRIMYSLDESSNEEVAEEPSLEPSSPLLSTLPEESSSSSSSPPKVPLKIPHPPLNIPPPPPNIPPPPLIITSPKSEISEMELNVIETNIKKITESTESTEIWPFGRFPQRSTFHNLSNLPPSIPSSPISPSSRSGKSSPSKSPSSKSPSKSSSKSTLKSPSPVETTSYVPINYSYGICEKCLKPRTGVLWCQSCYSLIFGKNFHNWTSGSYEIDAFIKKTQLNSNHICELFEWIPFEKTKDLQLIGEGGYSTVYSAKWIDGRILDLNEDGKWERTGENDVVLKILHDSKDLSQEYLNELESYHKLTPKLNHVLRCYGISRDPFAKNTIMVMEYAKDGSLKDYLKNNFAKFTWVKRISILNDIAQSLKSVHAVGLIHKNLHSGNVLLHDDCAFIGDLGLCQKKDSTSLHGVMPYVAPEVLKGNQFTVASDVYSFGMIMYELAVSLPPYYNYSSDENLLHDICDEIRPKVPESVPNCYLELMTKCWTQNPDDRPDADYIVRIIEDWKNNISEEFNVAEKIRSSEIDETTNIREKLLGNYKSKALLKIGKNE